jgi:hypothetical protein
MVICSFETILAQFRRLWQTCTTPSSLAKHNTISRWPPFVAVWIPGAARPYVQEGFDTIAACFIRRCILPPQPRIQVWTQFRHHPAVDAVGESPLTPRDDITRRGWTPSPGEPGHWVRNRPSMEHTMMTPCYTAILS